MNNFHYLNSQNVPKTEKTTKLVQELQSIEKQLQEDHRRLAQKRKLQQQFYEDTGLKANNANNVNRMNLADQIMNQLLNPKERNIPYVPQQKIKFNQFQGFKNIGEQPNYNDNVANINANYIKNISPDPRVKQPVIPAYHNPVLANQVRPPQRQVPRQNQIVNKRQLQKMKLQNMNAQQQFPFGNNSRQKDRRKPQYQPRSPQREPPMKDNYIPIPKNKPRPQKQKQVIQNPFLKDQPTLKQKRQQQQKRYRLLLEQQMQEQKRRKQQQKLRLKQEQRQKYNNVPIAGNAAASLNQNKANIQNINRKRRDPNAQHVPLQKPSSQIRQSDIQFMKHQVLDLKNKFKKGRINHEQYQTQIKKLEAHYKIRADQVVQNQIEEKIQQKNENTPNQIQNLGEQSIKSSTQRQKNPSIMHYNEQQHRKQIQTNRNKSNMNPIINQYGQQHYTNISVPIQSMTRQPIPSNFSNYQPSSAPNLTNQPNDYQMQMMFKLLDEFKSIFKMQTQSHLNDKKALQETLNKMIPNFNPIMMTQQVPTTQLPQPPKQFHTQAKKVEKFDQFPRNNIPGVQYSYPHSSQSEISSSYIEKSLSGIVNKIPLTKKQKQEQKVDPNKDIVKFYQRKYKIKKFKGFQYTQTQNQSSILIPSVSNFLQTKNSQNELSAAFQRDLRNYKKMEKDRDLQAMILKIKKTKQQGLSSSSSSSSNPSKIQKKKIINQQLSQQTSNFYQPQQQIKKTKNLQPQQNLNVNPFLKKHISNDSNQSNQSSQPNNSNSSNKFNSYENVASPAAKSSQILQQQEYQTENKRSQNSSPQNSNKNMHKFKKNEKQINTYNAKPLPTNTQPPIETKPTNKEYPSSKILDTMKKNNQILAKYQRSPSPNYQSNFHGGSNSISSVKQSNRIESSKQFQSREYFSGHQISPVQRREYQSSLETVRSQQQSGKFQRKNNMDMLMGSNQRSSYSNNYQSPIPSAHSINVSPTIQSVQVDKVRRNYQIEGVRLNDYYKMYPNIGHSQTVQSIQESQSKLANFQKPPNNNSRKNGRTVSRKKESVIKIANNSSNNQSPSYKDQLSGIPSEGSKQRSSMLKPPSSRQQNQSKLSSAKFDSNMYQSGYEQTVGPCLNNRQQASQSRKIGPNQNSTPNTFKQVLEKNPQLQKSVQSRNSSLNQDIRYTNQQLQNQPQPSQPTKPVIISAPKWRSLQQARKIAKQCRLKSGEDLHNRSSVQQKLSQLQSFIHNNPNAHLQSSSGLNAYKKQESSIIIKNKKQQQKNPTTTKKKDISKILDDLGEDEYEPDFESYKQQSER